MLTETIWRDYQSTDIAVRTKAESQIYTTLLTLMRAAVYQYNPQWMSADDREDFIQKEMLHFRTYSLNQFRLTPKNKFKTFVYTNVKNHLNSAFEQHKRTRKNAPVYSLNEPISEDGGELIDMVEDTRSVDTLGEIIATNMLSEIYTKLEEVNSTYPKILRAWLDTNGNRHEAAIELREQGVELNPYTIYRVIRCVRQIVVQQYPETLCRLKG